LDDRVILLADGTTDVAFELAESREEGHSARVTLLVLNTADD
jgi:hypothetical protein